MYTPHPKTEHRIHLLIKNTNIKPNLKHNTTPTLKQR